MHTFIKYLLIISLALYVFPAFAVKVGNSAPAFQLQAIAVNQQKGSIDLSQYQGQVIYLDFWASWCPPCRKSLPLLDDLYKKYKEKGFTVIGISEDAGEKEALGFLNKVPVSFPTAWDNGGSAASAYGLLGMPYAYIIDRKGVVRHIHPGFKKGDIEKIEKHITSLLKEQAD